MRNIRPQHETTQGLAILWLLLATVICSIGSLIVAAGRPSATGQDLTWLSIAKKEINYGKCNLENLSVVFRSGDHYLSGGLPLDGKKSWVCNFARPNEYEWPQPTAQIQKNNSCGRTQGLLEKRTINKPISSTIRQPMLWSYQWVAQASAFFMPNFNKEAFYKGNNNYE
jgi:hypothetical protein